MQSEPKLSPILKTKVGSNLNYNVKNTKSAYGKPNEQLSPKSWPLSYLNLTKYDLDTQKVKTVQKPTPKQANTKNQIRSTTFEQHKILHNEVIQNFKNL